MSARKEASQARLELAKVSRSSEHRAQEASCLKAALKGRDVLLEEMQGRVRQLEDELARCGTMRGQAALPAPLQLLARHAAQRGRVHVAQHERSLHHSPEGKTGCMWSVPRTCTQTMVTTEC